MPGLAQAAKVGVSSAMRTAKGASSKCSGKKVFFFEKKNQKTFIRLVPRKVTQARAG
jgi:hypothetical protein